MKLEAIIAAVASELAARCTCNFTSALIENAVFRCVDNPNDVVVFAQLSGIISDDVLANDLIDYLMNWVASDVDRTVAVLNDTLTLSGECPVEIDGFTDTPCGVDTGDSDDDDDDEVGAIVGGVVGGVVLIALIIIVIVIILIIVKRKRTTKWDPKR